MPINPSRFIRKNPAKRFVDFPAFKPSVANLGLGGNSGYPDQPPIVIPAPYSVIIYFYTGQDNEPAGNLYGMPDEDQVLVRRLGLTSDNRYLQPYVDSAAEYLYGLPDENERWVNPNSPLVRDNAYPQPWVGEQFEQGPRYFEDETQRLWRQVSIAGGTYVQPWSFDYASTGTFGLPDVDQQWDNPLKPCVSVFKYPDPSTFDVQEPAGSLFGLPDEDIQLNRRTLGIFAQQRYVQPWVDSGAIGTFGLPDVDQQWDNPLRRCEYLNRVPDYSAYDVQEPAGSLFGVADEDVQLNRRTLGVYNQQRYLQPWVDDGSVNTFTVAPADEVYDKRITGISDWVQRRLQPWVDSGSANTFPQPIEEVYNQRTLSLRSQYNPWYVTNDNGDLYLFSISTTGIPDDDQLWMNPNRQFSWNNNFVSLVQWYNDQLEWFRAITFRKMYVTRIGIVDVVNLDAFPQKPGSPNA